MLQEPESIVQERVDQKLMEAGWTAQDRPTLNPHTNYGGVVGKFPNSDSDEEAGFVGYTQFVDCWDVCAVDTKQQDTTILSKLPT